MVVDNAHVFVAQHGHAGCVGCLLLWFMIKEFREIFNLVDKDKGGTISVQEVQDLMDMLGMQMSEAETRAMVAEIDLDGNGEIDFPEFLTMMLRKMNTGNVEKELKEVFTVFDQDGSGTISRQELRAALSMLGEKLTDEEVEEAIKFADTSGDGEIEYDEFIQLVLNRDDARK